jgi:hypothetical protein
MGEQRKENHRGFTEQSLEIPTNGTFPLLSPTKLLLSGSRYDPRLDLSIIDFDTLKFNSPLVTKTSIGSSVMLNITQNLLLLS